MSRENDETPKQATDTANKPRRAMPPIPPKPAVPQPAAAKFKVEAEQKEAARQGKEGAGDTKRAAPTRYGDWEKNGRCIDF